MYLNVRMIICSMLKTILKHSLFLCLMKIDSFRLILIKNFFIKIFLCKNTNYQNLPTVYIKRIEFCVLEFKTDVTFYLYNVSKCNFHLKIARVALCQKTKSSQNPKSIKKGFPIFQWLL